MGTRTVALGATRSSRAESATSTPPAYAGSVAPSRPNEGRPPRQSNAYDPDVNRLRAYGSSLSIPGLVGALALFAASTRPSLIPRGWLFQSVLSALCTVLGYAAGVLVWWLVNKLGMSWRPSPQLRARLLIWLAAVGAVIVAIALFTGTLDQRRLAALWGLDQTPAPFYSGVLLVTLVVSWGLLALSRWIRRLSHWVRDWLRRWLPDSLAAVIAVAVVGALVWFSLSGLVNRVILGGLSSAFEARDVTTREAVEPPENSERSGSPESLVAWEELGFEGRNFAAGGPSASELSEYAGAEAIEPIRAFVGLATQDVPFVEADLDEAAELAVAELDRTNAWERDVLVVVTTTGTGWVVPQAAAGVEYMHAGNTAIVAMQYSPNPSWVTLLLDRQRAADAGVALFEAVHDRWSELPEDSRPRLVLFGESLGAFGGSSAFSGLQDFSARADGALWTGTPRFAPLWANLTAARDAGSTEVHPILDGGDQVRWATSNGGDQELFSLPATWNEPRVVFVQHPSDGVVWWELDLAISRPDWTVEPPGQDVLDMTWLPIVTFLQVSFDMFVAVGDVVSPGFGHLYAEAYADGWAAIAAPQGWEEADTARLRERLLEIALGG